MIVISGALVLVAAVLLVLGIVSSITLVYAAIGLSLVSAVFLLVGVFQRPVVAAERSSSDDEPPTRAAPAVKMSKPKQPEQAAAMEPAPPVEYVDEFADADAAADYPLEAANADFEQRAESTGADVLVISGRPRYHVGGCEYVEGHEESEPLDIVEARELGFTPCGVCRPNETLARGPAGSAGAVPPPAPVPTAAPTVVAPLVGVVPQNGSNGGSAASANGVHPVAPVTAEQPAVVAAATVSEPAVAVAAPVAAPAPTPPPVAEPVTAAPVAEPVVAVAPVAQPIAESVAEPAAPAKAARAPRKRAPRAKKPPVEASTQTEAASAAPEAASASPTAEAAEAATAVTASPAAPIAAAAPAAPAKAPARARAATRTVLAVALTKEYHRSGCVLLEGVDADELTKAAAIRQGFLACGVCKP